MSNQTCKSNARYTIATQKTKKGRSIQSEGSLHKYLELLYLPSLANQGAHQVFDINPSRGSLHGRNELKFGSKFS